MSKVTVIFEVDDKSTSKSEVLMFLSCSPNGISINSCVFEKTNTDNVGPFTKTVLEEASKQEVFTEMSTEDIPEEPIKKKFFSSFDELRSSSAEESFDNIEKELEVDAFLQGVSTTKSYYSRGDIVEAMPTERKQLHANFFTKLQNGDYGEQNILIQKERLTPKARLFYLDPYTLVKVRNALDLVKGKHYK